MSEPGFQLSYLRDGRLAPLATSALPAWLWSTMQPASCGQMHSARPSSERRHQRPSVRTDSTPTILPPHRSRGSPRPCRPAPQPRLERLRGFGAGFGHSLTCACSHIVLADDAAAILVVAVERAGPDLLLGERTVRLLAGSEGADCRVCDRGRATCRHRKRARASSQRGVACRARGGSAGRRGARERPRRREARWQTDFDRPHRQRRRDGADRQFRCGRRWKPELGGAAAAVQGRRPGRGAGAGAATRFRQRRRASPPAPLRLADG